MLFYIIISIIFPGPTMVSALMGQAGNRKGATAFMLCCVFPIRRPVTQEIWGPIGLIMIEQISPSKYPRLYWVRCRPPQHFQKIQYFTSCRLDAASPTIAGNTRRAYPTTSSMSFSNVSINNPTPPIRAVIPSIPCTKRDKHPYPVTTFLRTYTYS